MGSVGLAMRARKVSFGDTLIHDIRSKKAKLVLLASNASENTKKKVKDKSKFYQIEMIEVVESELLSKAVGKENIKAIGILDEGFANRIKKTMKG